MLTRFLKRNYPGNTRAVMLSLILIFYLLSIFPKELPWKRTGLYALVNFIFYFSFSKELAWELTGRFALVNFIFNVIFSKELPWKRTGRYNPLAKSLSLI
jgi:hypothetical protein